jgi:hypothetical protein
MRSNKAPLALLRPQIFMRATSYCTSGGIESVAMHYNADSFDNMLCILVRAELEYVFFRAQQNAELFCGGQS